MASEGSAVIVLAGATGTLGRQVARVLREYGADVRALVRPNADGAVLAELRRIGATVITVDHTSLTELSDACAGATCVVSTLAGLRDVIVETQSTLLAAAVAVGVPRFIPSDFCIDFTRLEPGTNRNLDHRREFRERLDRAPIAATSVFCGMFMDLLRGEAPIILFGRRRVLYWGDADQAMDFTTIADTAWFTAMAALDDAARRDLRIAGDVQSARGLATAARDATGMRFGLLRPGGLRLFGLLIRLTRRLVPGTDALYPPWQGMQYLRDMLGGQAKLAPLDNGRYPGASWTSVRDFLVATAPGTSVP